MATTNQFMEANNQFMRKTDATLPDQSAAIKNLETQMGQMAISMTGRAPENLPRNTEINPKEQAKAITTRNRVQLPEIHVKRSGVIGETFFPVEDETVVKESTPKENSEKSQDKVKVTVIPYEPPIPFPQRCLATRSFSKILYQTNADWRTMRQALCDLGASINLMPLSIFKKLGLGEPKATTVTLQLADRSLTHLRGIIEDALVKVDKLIFPTDFLILDMEEDKDVPIILGRPFLATARALIDVQQGQLTLKLGKEQVSFNIFKTMKYPNEPESYFQIEVLDIEILYNFELKKQPNIHETCIVHSPFVLIDSKKIKAFNVEFHTGEERMTNHLEKDRDEIRRITAVRNKTIMNKLCRTFQAIFNVP
ncbi:uncharacterized protein LOC111394989 [Olea europaea var. sylvestris]|uniref:uncharacterized protein LOC111394989 n=1 Tax=Olea europaea var. sylvestris TaxID=158386 RepID=UPI000C1D21C5|nr:uncharacterized protein LOC111394989 [Olea europaea var. sylvestris]